MDTNKISAQKQLLAKHLIGRRITTANDGTLTLDDGTSLTLYESAQDCCAAAFGEWKILDADRLEAAITNVEYEYSNEEDEDGHRESFCRITILHNQNLVAQGDGYASAGNSGYYFSVLSLRIVVGGQIVHDEELISA